MRKTGSLIFTVYLPFNASMMTAFIPYSVTFTVSHASGFLRHRLTTARIF